MEDVAGLARPWGIGWAAVGAAAGDLLLMPLWVQAKQLVIAGARS